MSSYYGVSSSSAAPSLLPPPPRTTTTETAARPWFRGRDAMALLAAIVVTRLAWREPVAVSADLALLFYYPTHSSVPAAAAAAASSEVTTTTSSSSSSSSSSTHLAGPVLLDVDGDGAPEAWVVIRGTNQRPHRPPQQHKEGEEQELHEESDSYRIQVLDLKQHPARGGGGGGGTSSYYYYGPRFPPILVESKDEGLANVSAPIALTTGHLPLVASSGGAGSGPAEAVVVVGAEGGEGSTKIDERTRRYFCGTDWHDATTRCGTPCPKGEAGECPNDERCFADTSCDYYEHLKSKADPHKLSLSGIEVTTPAGSVPVVVTAWEKGVVTCDGLVVNNETNRLEIRNLWSVKPVEARLGNNATVPSPSLNEWLASSKVEWVDAVTSGTSHGMVLVTASLLLHEDDDDIARILFALDAKTGSILWETLSEQWLDRDSDPQLLLPLTEGTARSSAARRRTLARPSSSSHRFAKTPVPNCLHAFKRSILTSGALPHVHWTENDARSRVLHFDPQVRLQQQQQRQRGAPFPRRGANDKSKGRATPRHLHPLLPSSPLPPKFGRPNVVATFTDTGLHVRSLKNGHELCHLSLWDKTLYADLNHDGTLDSIHVVTLQHRIQDDDDALGPHRDWVRQLADRVSGEKLRQRQKEEGRPKKKRSQDLYEEVDSTLVALCHVQALSGLPSQEELFSTNVCGTDRTRGRARHEANHPDEVEAAPPLLVEARGRTRYGSYDVLTAVSSGVVTRVDGLTGKKQWQLKFDSDIPRWEQDDTVLFTRINTDAGTTSALVPPRSMTMMLPPRARPILLAGEDGMIILSPNGKKLASVKFPQPSLQRPALMDVNGDGVVDVVVTTTDAVWAYAVVLRASSTSMFRMGVGLVLLGILLALLRNRFQKQPGKRTTDA